MKLISRYFSYFFDGAPLDPPEYVIVGLVVLFPLYCFGVAMEKVSRLVAKRAARGRT